MLTAITNGWYTKAYHFMWSCGTSVQLTSAWWWW